MNKLLFGKSSRTVKFIAKAGIMLALTIVVQYVLGLTKIQLLVGSAVNFFILFSALACGMIGGIIVGLFTPFIAFFIGIAGNITLVPFIALGNVIFAVVYSLLINAFKVSYINGIKDWKNTAFAILSFALSAVVKFLYMYFIALKIILPLILAQVPPAVSVTFGVTQLFTALIGGVVAMIIAYVLSKSKLI